MKIILREHVEHLGDRGDVVRVAAGYARNFLLPKGLAYPAGEGSAKQIADQQRTWAKKEARHETAAQSLGALIGALELTIRRRAGENGTLYGSVTNGDIAALLAQSGYEVDRRKIQLKEPIKSLGDFEVHAKLHRSVTAALKLHVLNEAGQTLAEVQALRKSLEPAETPDDDDEDREFGERDERPAKKPAARASAEDGNADEQRED